MQLSPEQKAAVAALAKDGRIRPEDVVEAAQRDDSPLHPLFEWNYEKAAYEHWLNTARGVIRSVQVVITTTRTEITVPQYVRDPARSPRRSGYAETERLRDEETLGAASLALELNRAIGCVRRAAHLARVYGLHGDEIDNALGILVSVSVELRSDAEGERGAAGPGRLRSGRVRQGKAVQVR